MNKSETYADPILTAIAVAYTNDRFFAERLFPTVQVDKRTGFYHVWDRANFRVEDNLREGRAESAIVDDEAVKTPYGPLLERSLKTFIEQDLLDHSDIDSLEAKRTERLRHRMLVVKEVELASVLSDAAVITQNATLSGTDQWSDYANSDPYGDLEEMLEEVRTGSQTRANRVAMSQPVWNKLKYHPDTITLLKAQGGGRFTPELLADWLNVNEVIVMDSQYNTAAEGQSDSMTDVWGKHVWAMYVNPNPSPSTDEPSAGYHLQLTDGVQVLPAYRNPNEPDIGEWIKTKDYYEAKLVDAGAISLRKNVIA